MKKSLIAAAVVASLSVFAETARADDRSNSEQNEKERKEAFRIGPLLGVGFPRPFAIEGFAKVHRVVGFGLEYSFLPRMNIADVDTSFRALAADLRVFPFKGGFFIGARVGKQWLDARRTVTVAPLGTFSESLDAQTWFVNPRLGFLYTLDSGITLGIDAGVQLPVNPSYVRDGDATRAGITTSVDQTLKNVAGTLGNETTPTLDLLRVGFLF